MKYLLILIFGLSLSCSNKAVKTKKPNQSIEELQVISNNKKLETDTVIVTLEYYGWFCPCPQWITPENKIIYESRNIKTDSTKKLNLFWNIKPKNDFVKNPFDLTEAMKNLTFEFKGQFYIEPQFLGDEGEQGPAKTLLYYSVKQKK